MFSISFLPWMLLLLGVVLSIPILSFVETSRRKKELAAAESATTDEEVGEGMEEEEGVFGDQPNEEFATEEGAPEEAGFEAVVDEGQAGDFGQPEGAEMPEFDDDAFK